MTTGSKNASEAWKQMSGRYGQADGRRRATEEERNARFRERLGELAVHAWEPAAELGALLSSPIYWGFGVPRGDGHAVLVLPGLFGGDQYLRVLRAWLRQIGYTSVRSGIDRNPGWSEELVGELSEIVAREQQRDGRRVTIIGHSMGGMLARSVAVRHPRSVGHVVTLGSPLRLERGRVPEGVRLTAIYSREDRIVRHPGAMASDGRTRNLEVRGSHTGLAFNPAVYRLLGDLLRADRSA